MSILEETEQKMKQALVHLKEELKGIRTGQASPALVEGVMVEVYGTQMRLLDVASITTPEARQLLITPFDANNSAAIGKAIERANIGFTPIVEGNCVRLLIPPMDEARRKEMAALCHQFGEKSKVSVRNIRREANEAARKQKSESIITEDELKKKEQAVQKLTDTYCEEVDQLVRKKEEEVRQI